MADGSAIEWTDATWQITTGCSVVSPGCTNCYAQRLAGTRLQHHPSRRGLTTDSKAGPVWNGKVRFNEEWLDQPLHWKRRRRVFVSAHGDLFHENIADDWIDRVFAVMVLCPQHTFQVLTKRAARMRDYVAQPERGAKVWWQALKIGGLCEPWPLPNVWLGVSVEDQARADERIPLLLETPAAKRFISAEPLLGPVNVKCWLHPKDFRIVPSVEHRWIHWVIAGGESGKGARPMHREWARKLRGDCVLADVPFFFKQWGEWQPHTVVAGGDLGADMRADRVRIVHPSARSNVEISVATGGYSTEPGSRYMARVGKKAAGRLLDGREWSEFPA
jgi:protein gp37